MISQMWGERAANSAIVTRLLMMIHLFFFQISVKYDEMRRQDKNWKGKTEPEKHSLWVDAALQVKFLNVQIFKKNLCGCSSTG